MTGKFFLVRRFNGQIGDIPISGVETIGYDAASQTYPSQLFDNYGRIHLGDEFIDPGDSIRVGAANGIRFISSGENAEELPYYPGFKLQQELVGDTDRHLSTAGV